MLSLSASFTPSHEIQAVFWNIQNTFWKKLYRHSEANAPSTYDEASVGLPPSNLLAFSPEACRCCCRILDSIRGCGASLRWHKLWRIRGQSPCSAYTGREFPDWTRKSCRAQVGCHSRTSDDSDVVPDKLKWSDESEFVIVITRVQLTS